MVILTTVLITDTRNVCGRRRDHCTPQSGTVQVPLLILVPPTSAVPGDRFVTFENGNNFRNGYSTSVTCIYTYAYTGWFILWLSHHVVFAHIVHKVKLASPAGRHSVKNLLIQPNKTVNASIILSTIYEYYLPEKL